MKVKELLEERIASLRRMRRDATANPGRWWQLRDIEELLDFNRKLFLTLFGSSTQPRKELV